MVVELGTLLPNLPCISLSYLILWFLTIAFATAMGVTAFLIMVAGSTKQLSKELDAQGSTSLSLLTNDFLITETKCEIENHIDELKQCLIDKQNTLDSTKNRLEEVEQNVYQIHHTMAKVKEQYKTLQNDVPNVEEESKRLITKVNKYQTELNKYGDEVWGLTNSNNLDMSDSEQSLDSKLIKVPIRGRNEFSRNRIGNECSYKKRGNF